MMNQRLEEFLTSRGATYELVRHPDGLTAQEQAGASHTPGEAWIKAVLVKTPHGFAVAAVPACCAADLDRIKGFLGAAEIRLATVEEMMALAPDCELGALVPFGRIYGLETVADRSFDRQRDVTVAAGDRRTAVRMRGAEFLRLAAPILGDFAIHGAPPPVRVRVRPRPARRRPVSGGAKR
jgi:Ala-tRNA(Pro) deacylase